MGNQTAGKNVCPNCLMPGKLAVWVAGHPTCFFNINNFAVNPVNVGCRPNSRQKRLPKVLNAWKIAFIFYSVTTCE